MRDESVPRRGTLSAGSLRGTFPDAHLGTGQLPPAKRFGRLGQRPETFGGLEHARDVIQRCARGLGHLRGGALVAPLSPDIGVSGPAGEEGSSPPRQSVRVRRRRRRPWASDALTRFGLDCQGPQHVLRGALEGLQQAQRNSLTSRCISHSEEGLSPCL